MNDFTKFLEKMSDDLKGTNWTITGKTEYIEVIKGEEVYAELPNESRFDKQDDYYVEQIQHGEDSFSGIIIYPIIDNKAFIIKFDC